VRELSGYHHRLPRTNTGYTNAAVTPTAIESVTPATLSPVNKLWGGDASLIYRLDSGQSIYATVSRGYKAGGFNLSQGLLPSQLSFNPETDVNFETGYKADVLDHRLKIDADVFYLYRQDAQIKSSFQSDRRPRLFRVLHRQCGERAQLWPRKRCEWRATDRVTLGADLASCKRISRISCNNRAAPARRRCPYRASSRMRRIGRQR